MFSTLSRKVALEETRALTYNRIRVRAASPFHIRVSFVANLAIRSCEYSFLREMYGHESKVKRAF